MRSREGEKTVLDVSCEKNLNFKTVKIVPSYVFIYRPQTLQSSTLVASREAYLEPSQVSVMEHFTKMINS